MQEYGEKSHQKKKVFSLGVFGSRLYGGKKYFNIICVWEEMYIKIFIEKKKWERKYTFMHMTWSNITAFSWLSLLLTLVD